MANTLTSSRPKKVAAGQADGIQPRTIEVLQVWLRLSSHVTSFSEYRATVLLSVYSTRATRCM